MPLDRSRTLLRELNDKSAGKQSKLFAKEIARVKRRESVRRVSIMPTYLDKAESKGSAVKHIKSIQDSTFYYIFLRQH